MLDWKNWRIEPGEKVRKVQESMEKARKRLRICLIAVVILAVIVGCAYYFGDFGKDQDVTEGTLVRAQQNTQDKTATNVSCTDSERILVAEIPGGSVYGWQ